VTNVRVIDRLFLNLQNVVLDSLIQITNHVQRVKCSEDTQIGFAKK